MSYKHEWVNDDARFVVFMHGNNIAYEYISFKQARKKLNSIAEGKICPRYTAQQRELEALNDGWVLWSDNDEEPKRELYVQLVYSKGSTHLNLPLTHLSAELGWSSYIIAYRLSNADGYKDGIKQDDKPASNEYDEINGDYILRNKPGWDGKGLPPVGTVCDIAIINHTEYVESFVNFIGRHYCVFTPKGSDREKSCGVKSVLFRPIQSKRDKAIEKVMEGLEKALQLDMQSQGIRDAVIQTVHEIDGLGMLTLPDGDGE